MRGAIGLFLVVAAIFLGAGPLLAQEGGYIDPPSRVGRLSLIEGVVSARHRGDQDWSMAVLNYPVTTGDIFWTEPGSRDEIRIGPTAIRMDGGSEVEISRLDDRNLVLNLPQGAIYLRVGFLGMSGADGSAFSVETPLGVVRIRRAGAYHIEIGAQGGPLRVAALEGAAEVADANSVVQIREGNEGVITGSNQLGYSLGEAEPTPFDDWSLARDDAERAAAAQRYLSPEMTGYEDLDRYGQWSSLPDYGPVWIPSAVPADWAPYRYGHWAYIQPWGWTWIDDAPWGFAPFHYGRWVVMNDRWAWAPGPPDRRPIWAPALVVFVGGAAGAGRAGFGGEEHVGWFPLGPHEAYSPPYHSSEAYIRALNAPNSAGSGRGREGHGRAGEGAAGGGGYVNQNRLTVVPRAVVAEQRPVARAMVPGAQRFNGQAPSMRAPALGGPPAALPSPLGATGRGRISAPAAPIVPPPHPVRPPVPAQAPSPPRMPPHDFGRGRFTQPHPVPQAAPAPAPVPGAPWVPPRDSGGGRFTPPQPMRQPAPAPAPAPAPSPPRMPPHDFGGGRFTPPHPVPQPAPAPAPVQAPSPPRMPPHDFGGGRFTPPQPMHQPAPAPAPAPSVQHQQMQPQPQQAAPPPPHRKTPQEEDAERRRRGG